MNDEKFLSLLDSLIEINENTPVIVEGIRDEKALRKIGLKGKIIIFNRGKSLYDFSEIISNLYNEVIILFDNDRRGRYLTRYVSRILESKGVRVNLEYRDFIFSMLEMKGIEEISTFYEESIERRINGKRRRMQ
ncbi:MAG: hypothetical protein JHC29_01260 [Thermoplasmata archaeon]|jgi:dTMP kinase|nr:hypothetical protein [Thermoplasmata archaeon]MVT13316.1 hypothetical protein [Euryarchaeota archaeon]